MQTMIDFDRIVAFQWDAGNARKHTDKHMVSQIECERIFFHRPMLLAEGERHHDTEPRFHVLGVTKDGRGLHITFTLRDDATRIRIISARDMGRQEWAQYEQDS